MKINPTRAPIIGTRQRSRLGSAARMRRLVLIGGLASAVAAGIATAGSPVAKAAVSLSPKAVTAVTTGRPPVGSYSALNPQNNEPITFFVSSTKTSLQDISIPFVNLDCTPGNGTPQQPLAIATAPILANGSFTATTTQTGVYAGYKATFTYTFRGHYKGLNPQGVPTVTGTFQETLKSADPTAHTCTSGTPSWTATRDTQPTQTNSAPPAGSYSTLNPQNNEPITFFVSSTKTSLQDISIPFVNLDCSPGNATPQQPLAIATAPILANGSFTATTTQTGVYAGQKATFTYNFRGNFHGLAPSGAARAAGTFQETLTYTNGAAYKCTSNLQSWTATRDTQPTQTKSPPPAGTYSTLNPQNNEPITFSVSSSKTSLQDISIPFVNLDCAPGNATIQQPLAIKTTPIGSGESFTATVTKTGVYAGHKAKFTYNFRGNFHGLAPSGAARAAGTFQETLTYTNGTAYTCTSNTQSWTATRNS